MDAQMLRAGVSVPCCSQHQTHRAVQHIRGRLCTAAGRCSPARPSRQLRARVIAAAGKSEKPDQTPAQQNGAAAEPKPKPNGKRRGKKGGTAGKTVSLTLRRTQEEAAEVAEAFTLNDFNPVAIGKRSRQVRRHT